MMNWKKPVIYCVSFISCFFACVAIIFACADEADPYDYYVSFFHNNIQGQKDYGAFYFTNNLFLYSETEPESEAAINAGEWAAYLGKGVTAGDVAKAMYHLSHQADSDLYAGYLNQKGGLPDSLVSNTFLKTIITNKSALKYYRFAKSAEKIANIEAHPWEPTPMDTVALRNAGAQAFTFAAQEKDKFIQLRYYYQAQRLLHYGASYNQASVVYDKYLAPVTSASHVKGWALSLKAGELRRLKDTVRAAYLFSKIFAQYPERRVQAYRNYQYMHVNTNQVLTLATNAAERANIYAIDGFADPKVNITPLQQVYALSPTSPMVGVLLIREINKLEEYYLTPKLHPQPALFSFDATMRAGKDNAVLLQIRQLKDLSKQLAADKKYPDAEIGTLAAAYLAWMQGSTAEGSLLLKALYAVKLKPEFDDQKQIIQLLLSAQSIQKYNRVNEAVLLPTLQWLDKKAKAERKIDTANIWNEDKVYPFTSTERNFYTHILAPVYLKQQDTTMTALALGTTGESDFWSEDMHSSNVRTVMRWKLLGPTPFVTFLVNKVTFLNTSYLNELLGTTCLREHQYARAVNAFKRVEAVYLDKDESYTPADPFIERINDYPKIYTYAKGKGYNKLQFAEAMANLQQQIKNDPANRASYYYKMATGLYNTSTYGNAWYLISYDWSAYDFGRATRNYYDADYIKALNAEEYFLIAGRFSKTEEFKAKCIYMAAKCRQKQATAPDYSAGNFNELQKAYQLQLRGSDLFTDLKTNYKRTAFYKKAVSECSYLKDFIVEK
ncbi:hypothetical protein ACFGVR_06950 [Mucilaginibacter sp. AW1-3]